MAHKLFLFLFLIPGLSSAQTQLHYSGFISNNNSSELIPVNIPKPLLIPEIGVEKFCDDVS